MSTTWRCSGTNRHTGKFQTMRLHAASKEKAIQSAEASGLVGVTARMSGLLDRLQHIEFGGKANKKELSRVVRSLATTAGTMNEIDSLKMARRELRSGSGMGEVLDEIVSDMERGRTPKQAFDKQVKHLGENIGAVYVAGSRTGRLSGLLSNLANEMERQGRIQGHIRGAMAYPAVLLVITIGVIFMQGRYIYPNLLNFIEEAEGTPPRLMSATVDMVDWIVSNLLLLSILGLVVLLGFRIFVSRPEGAAQWGKAKLRFPIFGKLGKKNALASMCSNIGVLLSAGVSVPETLRLVIPSVKNKWIRGSLERVFNRVDVSSITPDAAFAAEVAVLTEIPANLMRQSQSGVLDTGEPWTLYGDSLSAENERYASQLGRVLEPILIVIVGSLVLLMALTSAQATQAVQTSI